MLYFNYILVCEIVLIDLIMDEVLVRHCKTCIHCYLKDREMMAYCCKKHGEVYSDSIGCDEHTGVWDIF